MNDLKSKKIEDILKEYRTQKMIDAVDYIVRYARELDKAYYSQKAEDILNGKIELSGIDFITELLKEGIIQVDVYLKMRLALKYPDAKIEINVI